MSQAIIYVNKDSVYKNDIDKDQTDKVYIDKDNVDKSNIDESCKTSTSIPEPVINIVIDKELNKETLLTGVARACDFPAYFGHNWDALWDCLTDSEVQYLRLDLTAIEKINTEDFNIFKSIIEDAYRDFGQPQLWVVE